MFKDNTFYLTKRSLMNQFNEMICNNEKKQNDCGIFNGNVFEKS